MQNFIEVSDKEENVTKDIEEKYRAPNAVWISLSLFVALHQYAKYLHL